MTVYSTHRGYKMELASNGWVYCDTKNLVSLDKDRCCGKCGKINTKEDHDGCLGTLKYIMNACCGHGKISEAFVQFPNSFCLKGLIAKVFISIIKYIK